VLTLTGLLLGIVVAERATALRTMAAREAEQRTLLAMAPDAILVTDDRGVIRVANAAADRLFGMQDRGAIGRRADELIGELRLEPQEGRATLSGRRAHGDEFPAEIAWSRLPDVVESGFLVIVRDVSERRRAEEQLREQDAVLAAAMRFAVAGELASALAHELNQPITALISYLRACEILAAPGGDAARLEATLDKSVQEAIRASNVLHRLRDFYQGAAPKHEHVQLPALCDIVLAAFKDRLRRADVSVRSDIDPSVPAIEADATHLEIVLHNLLANALEAVTRSPAGERRIALEVTHDPTSVTFRVEDSGPGVAPAVQRKLFDPFITDKVHGMGLGLAISQSLVRARGGDLVLEPARALGGACFAVRLPIQVPSDTAGG
jgi:two-component system sensor kinase FixL